ncbi:Cys-Gln thioester bond-forming surface protein [Streptomyces sp. TRM66268-LWL]|uniref:Cys-Gln thioester bond-forming surface protein n=1 Tax=Streptomyces polyasparticus TaxID=2767826 RepID=A0ABR7SUL5_9ACTN|nr:Cys-Gln thioester bond-forming surface protein [Streptomyces polyasparticus]MBC9718048.1 Cys-Gln thioester bond-forming surface protein [Streptomyces polyasparticus]
MGPARRGSSVLSSFVVRRRGCARLAVTLLVPGLLAAGALAGAGAAAAEENPQLPGGATATLGGLETYGQAVVREDGVEREVPAGLFEMSVDGGGMLKTYCIDIDSPTQQDARYRETSWSATSLSANKQAGKIRWILQNSYPQVNDLAELARKAGAAGLTEADAAAGTQVAIWRHSDGVDVSALDPQAERLADYLQKKARNMREPKASLTLDPPAVSGRAGERVGPVTVHTDARSVAVNPPADAAASGVKVVGEDGRPLTSAADGSELYFDLPKGGAGKAALTVQASTSVPVGRAFVSETRSQTQILAGSSESTVSATATVNWAEKGAIPALSAEPDCAAGGLDITAVNQGDREFTFSLMGFEHTIAAGEARTVTIPLQEDQAYDFTITGPNGFAERFKGVLDCRTEASGAAAGNDIAPQSAPSPATAGGTTTHDLAETGSSNATPMIAGVAVGFLVLGGVVVFLLRKKGGAAESGE